MKHMHLCYEIHKYKLTIHMCFNISQRIYIYILSGRSTPGDKHLHYSSGSSRPVPGNREGEKSPTLSAESSLTRTRLLIISYDDRSLGKPSWKASGPPRNRDVRKSGVPWRLLLSLLCEQLNRCYYMLKPHIVHLEYSSAMHHTLYGQM